MFDLFHHTATRDRINDPVTRAAHEGNEAAERLRWAKQSLEFQRVHRDQLELARERGAPVSDEDLELARFFHARLDGQYRAAVAAELYAIDLERAA